MRTRTENYLEERSYTLLKAMNRACNLMFRCLGAGQDENYHRARALYYGLNGKYDATCAALNVLRNDPIIKAWHMIGNEVLKAADELNVRPTNI